MGVGGIKVTVISHFWNNAAILPYWLRHHVRLFDHGIMIDHGASDGSVELIRRYAPSWEIRQTERCQEAFIASAADREVMAIEEEVAGWKMVLNVTEFLITTDVKAYIRSLPRHVHGVTTSGVVLVEAPQTRYAKLSDEPLFLQKTFGYFESELGKKPEDYGVPGVWRSRLLHDYPNGKYETGRHVTKVDHINDPRLFLAWAGWAPFELIKQMKMQVQTRIPREEFANDFSVQHLLKSEQDLDDRLAEEQARSHDLLSDSHYAAALQRMRAWYISGRTSDGFAGWVRAYARRARRWATSLGSPRSA